MNPPTFCTTLLLLAATALPARAVEAKVAVLRNRVYAERKSGPLGMDLYFPEEDGVFPGVLVVHGGAWTMGSRAQLAAVAMALAEHGYVAAAISYRLAPEHLFPAQLYDCQAAVRWLREHAEEFKLDPARIGGYGYSAGGHLVALLGALDDDDLREAGVPENAPSARLQAVVAGGAPCDFRILPADSDRLSYWLGGTRSAKPDIYREASPASYVTADDPPMYFFHGTLDFLVPIRSPQAMVHLLNTSGVVAKMHSIEGKGHIATVFDQDALHQALAFVDQYLKSSAGNAPAAAQQVATQPSEPAPLSDTSAKGSATDGR